MRVKELNKQMYDTSWMEMGAVVHSVAVEEPRIACYWDVKALRNIFMAWQEPISVIFIQAYENQICYNSIDLIVQCLKSHFDDQLISWKILVQMLV